MDFGWEPFGRTRGDEPPAAPAPPPAPGPTQPIALPREPARGLAVVSCMDCRIDPLQAFGLALGDAVVLRNAGAQVSDDVLRSLRMAHAGLGVRAVRVVGHTDCLAHRGDDAVATAEVQRGMLRIAAALPDLEVWGALLDVRTGAVAPVVSA